MDYVKEVTEHLQTKQYYEKFTEDPTELFSSEIKHVLENNMVCHQSIDEVKKAGLLPNKSKASHLYPAKNN